MTLSGRDPDDDADGVGAVVAGVAVDAAVLLGQLVDQLAAADSRVRSRCRGPRRRCTARPSAYTSTVARGSAARLRCLRRPSTVETSTSSPSRLTHTTESWGRPSRLDRGDRGEPARRRRAGTPPAAAQAWTTLADAAARPSATGVEHQRGGDRRDALAAPGEPQAVGGRGAEPTPARRRPRRAPRSASARRAPTLGRLPITWTLTLPTTKPGLAHQAHDLAEQRGTGGAGPLRAGRCRTPSRGRRGRRPRAARRTAACAATSPSEWPAQPPVSPGQCRQASQRARPSSNGWTSTPMPTRGGTAASGDDTGSPPTGEHGLGEHEVERAGHLERLLVDRDDDQHGTPSRLHEARRRRSPARTGRPPRGPAASDVATEALRRLDRPQRGAVERGLDPTPAASTCLTVSATGEPGTTASAPARTARRQRRRARAARADGRRRARGRRRPRRAAPRSARATESWRVSPPATTTTGSPPATGRGGSARRRAATLTPSGGGHDDEVDGARGGEGADGVHEHRQAAELPQRLGRTGPEPLPASGRRDDGRSGHVANVAPGVATTRGRPAGRVHGRATTVSAWPHSSSARARHAPVIRPKTRRPLAVVTTLVTVTRTAWPTRSRACSVTTIVPSSR